MFAYKSVVVLATLPFQLISVIIEYFLFGQVRRFRRYANRLSSVILIVLSRAILLMETKDTKIINRPAPKVLSSVKKLHPRAVELLPGYGSQFDEHSWWLVEQPDRNKDDLVVIYSHGGGYFLSLSTNQVESMVALYLLLSKEKRAKVSILVLDYKLVSDGHAFPTQMEQMHATYYRLLKTTSNIGLIGDSAGGNLTVGFTQYLKQKGAPAGDYPKMLAVISPWLRVYPGPDAVELGSSYLENSDTDLVPIEAIADEISRIRLMGEQSRFSLIWSPASKVPPSADDWCDIPTYGPKSKVFVLIGEDETLRDETLLWIKYALGVDWYGKNKYGIFQDKFEKENYELVTSHVLAYVEPWGYHDALFVFENSALGLIEKGEVTGPQDLEDEDHYGLKRLAAFLESAI